MTSNDFDKLDMYGYSTDIELPVPTEDMKQFFSFLNSITKNLPLDKTPLDVKTSTIVNSSRFFFDDYFRLHDVRIIRTNYDACFKRVMNKTDDPHRVKRVIEKCTYKASPFKIPVAQVGITGVRSYLFKANQNGFRFRKYPLKENEGLVYKYISVGKKKTITSPYEYTHEITHTQVDSHVGAIKNFYNNEVLSIFMEKLHSYHDGDDEFKAIEIQRLHSLATVLSFYNHFSDKLEDFAYIDSTIKAEILFDYYLSSDEMASFILEAIQKIFDGRYTLEKLLSTLGIASEDQQKYTSIERNLSR